MNATDECWVVGPSRIGCGFTYGIAFFVGHILLMTTMSLASHLRTPRPAVQGARGDAGLDEATLMSCPSALYSKSGFRDRGTTASCCCVCLADYRDTDVLRLLPDCGHLFHLDCVDPWLRLHPSCPVCRTSPLPSPRSAPLAE